MVYQPSIDKKEQWGKRKLNGETYISLSTLGLNQVNTDLNFDFLY